MAKEEISRRNFFGKSAGHAAQVAAAATSSAESKAAATVLSSEATTAILNLGEAISYLGRAKGSLIEYLTPVPDGYLPAPTDSKYFMNGRSSYNNAEFLSRRNELDLSFSECERKLLEAAPHIPKEGIPSPRGGPLANAAVDGKITVGSLRVFLANWKEHIDSVPTGKQYADTVSKRNEIFLELVKHLEGRGHDHNKALCDATIVFDDIMRETSKMGWGASKTNNFDTVIADPQAREKAVQVHLQRRAARHAESAAEKADEIKQQTATMNKFVGSKGAVSHKDGYYLISVPTPSGALIKTFVNLVPAAEGDVSLVAQLGKKIVPIEVRVPPSGYALRVSEQAGKEFCKLLQGDSSSIYVDERNAVAHYQNIAKNLESFLQMTQMPSVGKKR